MIIFTGSYWLLIGVGMLLSLWATLRVKSSFAKYSQMPTKSGMTGAEVARRILSDNDIHDVDVEPIAGRLTDHYDPSSKTLRLSEPVFHSRSMAAFGIAAHEVGHAIQHARDYAPLQFRSAWVPVANFGGGFSLFVILLAVALSGTIAGGPLSWLGIALFAATTLFTLITLPVEFDASRRALVSLEAGDYTTAEELKGARKVLNAAAMTYVAAFITSLLMLLYWASRLGLFSSGNK